MAADLAFKISPENLISNFSDFESWSKGTAVAPDGWASAGVAGAIAREATSIKFGTYSMRITSGSSSVYSAQYLYDLYSNTVFREGQEVSSLNYFPGKTIRFGCWVKCSSASKARIYINDGFTTTYSSYHTGSGNFEFLEVGAQVDDNCNQILFCCEVAATTVQAYFDGAIVSEGELLFTYFRGNTIYVRESDWDGQVTYSVGSFVVPRRQGTKIQGVQARNRTIKLRVQIYGATFPACRSIFDTIVKAVSGGKKELWMEDDRVSKVFLSNLPKLDLLANAQVYVFELQFTSEDPYENFVSKFRQKQAIATSPTNFSVVSNGSVFTLPRFYFLNPSGVTLNDLNFENLTTGERFSFDNTVAPGGTVMLDSDEIKLLVNNVDGLSNFSGDFIQLTPGTNNLRFTGTPGITIYVDWYDRFL